MQIRCYNCKMPFNLSRAVVYNALDMLVENNLTHYDARCPRCRKVNRVSFEQLKHAAPQWEPGQAATPEESDQTE